MIDDRLPRQVEIKRDAFRIIDDARREYFQNHREVAAVLLFSGGNDSTVLAHLMRDECSHFGHANTTIGVEQTREFVRNVAAEWGIPLLERSPDPGDRFEDVVREFGFPGPAQHFLAFQRLKERAIRKMQRELVSNPRKERILFISGVRSEESLRRSRTVREHWRDGSAVWVAPLANWTNEDMADYRRANPDVPHNEVTDHLHLSGECLCGAFAGEGEEELVRFFYPEIGEEFDRLAEIARANKVPEERCRWGWGAYRERKLTRAEWEQLTLDVEETLCSACDLRVAVEDENETVVELRPPTYNDVALPGLEGIS